MQKVLNQYADRITRIYNKAHSQKRPLSTNEIKGIAYYRAAAQCISLLLQQ